MMLDKNPEIIFNDIQKEFKKNVPNLILCSDSFHKIEFLNKIITSTDKPIIFANVYLKESQNFERCFRRALL